MPVITADGINSQEIYNYASDHLPLLSVRKMRCLHTKYVQCVYGFCGFGWTVIDTLIIFLHVSAIVKQQNIYCEVVNILVMNGCFGVSFRTTHPQIENPVFSI